MRSATGIELPSLAYPSRNLSRGPFSNARGGYLYQTSQHADVIRRRRSWRRLLEAIDVQEDWASGANTGGRHIADSGPLVR